MPATPTQASLDGMLRTITRVRVTGLPVAGRPVAVLLDTSAPADIAALRDCLKISEDPKSFAYAPTPGKPYLELYQGHIRAATLVCIGRGAIRWDAWGYDATLIDGGRLARWLADRGLTA